MIVENGRNNMYFKSIEESIKEIQKKNNVDQNLKYIKESLNKYYDGCTCKDIFISKGGKYIFGATVMPTESEVVNIYTNFLKFYKTKNKTYNITEYVIELDSNLLYDTKIRATSQEIMALILHEIGHIVMSDKLYRMVRGLRTSKALCRTGGAGILISTLTTTNPSILFLFIPLLIAKDMSINNLMMNNEQAADSYVLQKGYGKELESLMDKLLISNKTRPRRKHSKMDEDIDLILQWSTDVENNIRDRESDIVQRNRILQGVVKNDSPYMDSLLTKHIKNSSKYLFINKDRELNEKFFFKRKPRMLTDSDILKIEVEKQRIKTYDDKLYVIDLIDDAQNDILKFYDYYDKKDKSFTIRNYWDKKSKEFSDELNKLKDETIKIPISDKTRYDYKVIVDYPDGYEG